MVAGAQAQSPANEEFTPSGHKTTQRCIEVQIGSEKTLDCFNQLLKEQVDRVNPVLNKPPIEAGSQDIRTGVANIPAVRQQYGPNFGRSLVPYRPTNTYASPLR
ncbi:hypothetical protein BV133_2883 [Blastochloris viridis]|uniref:Uncharacterized protein n=1 Tax=Blastochloris viridis TaxID=1079 RepID=A0A182D4N7_BLAVI|nr:hypothetical protein BV133_2883 [Blastochloris viridis]